MTLARRRLPTLTRADPAELPGFRLTDRDLQIVAAVGEYRALTAPQIAALFFSKDQQSGLVNARCKARLRHLFHGGYLTREEQASRLSEGRRPLVYRLDSAGAKLLAERAQGNGVLKGSAPVFSPAFLDHLLATNDIRIAVSQRVAAHGWRILTWLDDRTLKSPQMKDQVTLKGEQGVTRRAAIVPDAYFRLETQEDTYNFFVEIDRGTVTGEASEWGRRDWARKIKTYLEYYRSGMYERRYKTSDMRVLTVTTGEVRLDNLKRITEEAGGKARFWFTTFAQLAQGDLLRNAVWRVASRKELVALVPTPGGTIFKYEPKE